jgi:hypothetical protein
VAEFSSVRDPLYQDRGRGRSKDSAEFQKSSGTRPFLGFTVLKKEPDEVEHVIE